MLLIAVDLLSNDVLHGDDGYRHFIMICQNDIQDATVVVVVVGRCRYQFFSRNISDHINLHSALTEQQNPSF